MDGPSTLSAGDEVFVFPTSFAQQRLWFLDRLVPDRQLYVVDVAMRLDGVVDLAALKWAADALVARHESLRTTFIAVDGVPFARVSGGRPVVVEVDADPLEFARRPFNLERGPLLRVCVIPAQSLLLVCIHHIVTDGWSMQIFLQELSALYAAGRSGRSVPLAPLPIQYADFAVWQRNELSGARLQELLAFWRGELAGAPALDLVTDRPRPALPSFQGGSVPVELTPAATRRLQFIAHEDGATLFMALLAVFSVLLNRYSGLDDVMVGTPVAGRTRGELEGLIGFFVNTLVLRIDLVGDPSFRDLLARTRDRAVQAYAHQDLPFEKLVEDLQPERDLSRNPLCQVFFQLAAAPSSEDVALAPLMDCGARSDSAHTNDQEPCFTWAPSPLPYKSSKFDLNLSLWDGPGGVGGRLEYSSELFERSTAARMAEHFQVLLEGLVADPNGPISTVPLLPPGDRRYLDGFNATAEPIPDLCVHELVDAQAARTPDARAVGDLSYRDLIQIANGLSHHLIARGVGPDSLVALSLPRGPDLVAYVLGVWKAGAAYLPLDPDDPEARRQKILADAHPVLVVSSPDAFPAPRESPPAIAGDPRRIAYAIYTSGSTGTPKAVLAEHRGVVNFLCWFTKAFPEPLPWITRLAFDASLKQVFAPLITGRPVWISPEESVMDPIALARELSKRRGVALNCVPCQWEAVLDAVESGHAPSLEPCLNTIMLGGERLSQALAARTTAAMPNAKLWNLYGPTEATSVATAALIVSGQDVAIGQPIANVRAVVADRHGEPVPIGVPGELWLSGLGLARGYLRRPELTNERFVHRGGQRFYRSGDRVRRRADGALEFLGRLDEQIKLGGLRIEPGELESHLCTHPRVKAAAVILRDGQLVAYVTGDATPDSLREYLRARVPAAMIPARIETLRAFPRTANGKIDKRSLPAPAAPIRQSRTALGRLEREIAGVWQEVLGVTEVGVHDNFFDLGGRSLLLVRVQARLTKRLNREISILELFRWPTIHSIAAHLTQELA
jgi:amino acid adenylation domain-containing protein